MRNILVPIDFSENSRHALDYAVSLAKRLQMKITLFHAYHPSLKEAVMDSYKFITDEAITGTPKDIRNELNAWHDALKASHPSILVSAVFTYGKLASAILKFAKTKKVDMIVMGTLGASGIKEVVFGSNTVHVIEQVSCPVFVVPMAYHQKKIRQIAFATNYREGDDDCIYHLSVMARELDAKVSVIHVIDDHSQPAADESLSEHFVSGIAKRINFDKIKFQCLKGSNILETINQFIKKEGIDLAAVSFKENPLIFSLFNRGLARKLVFHSQIPLLIFPACENESHTFPGTNAF